AGDDMWSGDQTGGHAYVILGKRGNDMLYGLFSNDTLVGGIGNDTEYGGPGSDMLRGGRGDDTLYGGPDHAKSPAKTDEFFCGPEIGRASCRERVSAMDADRSAR